MGGGGEGESPSHTHLRLHDLMLLILDSSPIQLSGWLQQGQRPRGSGTPNPSLAAAPEPALLLARQFAARHSTWNVASQPWHVMTWNSNSREHSLHSPARTCR